MRAAVIVVIGLASGTGAAHADGAASSDQPARVTVGGYLEMYYALNLGRPSNAITALRGFDDRDRTLTLSAVALDVKAERGPLTMRLIAQAGTMGASYYLAEPALPGGPGVAATGPELWRHVQQATATYVAPHALTVEAGLFPSPIGPEVFAVKDNWNWSRSDLFFGLPFYHTGARVSHPLGAHWTATAHLYTGWNSVVDNNRTPSVAASAAYAGRRVTAQVLYFGGSERPRGAPEGQAWRHLGDAYASVAITRRTTILVHADAGLERNRIGTSRWLAGALYGKVQLAPWLYAAARADYFREHVPVRGGVPASALFWPSAWVASGTTTLAAQPTAGVSVRLELRHDRAASESFFGGPVEGDGTATPYVPNRRSQTTLTAGMAAWF